VRDGNQGRRNLVERKDPIGRGDRKAIEERTKVWDKVIIDRSRELKEWITVLRRLKVQGYLFANNHYALCRRRHKAYNAAFRIMPN
jgi:hypothetical protein